MSFGRSFERAFIDSAKIASAQTAARLDKEEERERKLKETRDALIAEYGPEAVIKALGSVAEGPREESSEIKLPPFTDSADGGVPVADEDLSRVIENIGLGDVAGLSRLLSRQQREQDIFDSEARQDQRRTRQLAEQRKYGEDQAAAGRERLAQKEIMDKFERAQENRRSVASRATLRGEELSPEKLADLDMYRDAFLAEDSLPLSQRRSLMQDYKSGVADLGLQVDKSVYDQEQKRLEAADFRGAFTNAEGRFRAMFENKEGVRKEGGVSDADIATVRSALAKVYPNLNKSRISEAIESAAEIVAPEFPIPKRSVNLRHLENIVTTREGLNLSKDHPNLSQYSTENKEALSLAASPSHMHSFNRYVSETGELPDINEVLSGEIGRRFAIGQRQQLSKQEKEQEAQENIQLLQALNGAEPASDYIRSRVLEVKLKEQYESSKEGEGKVKAYRAYVNSSDTSNAFDTAKNKIAFTPPLDPKTGLPKWQFFKRPRIDPETREIAGYDIEVLEMPVEMGVLTPEEKQEKDRQLEQFNQFLNSPFKAGETKFLPLSPEILKKVGIPNANIEVERQD